MPMLQLSDYIRINQHLQDRIRDLEKALYLVTAAPREKSDAGGGSWNVTLTEEEYREIEKVLGFIRD